MKHPKQRTGLFGGQKICAVIAEPTASAAIRRVRDALKETRLLEIRLDYFSTRRETFQFLAWLRREKRKGLPAVCITTCRRREAGGRFRGDIAEQLAWLALAISCGCDWADVEIETSRRMRPGTLAQWLTPAKWLVSSHDFPGSRRKAASSSSKILHSLRWQGADAEKIAVSVRTLREAMGVIAAGQANQRTIAIPMGEIASPLRLLALRTGNSPIYSATGAATASGQPTLREAVHLYRANKLNSRTRVYGVIGDPIEHSLSPCLHNAGFQAAGMDAVLLPFFTHDLGDFIRCIASLGISGFAVTLPHKEDILRCLYDCDSLAAKIGAVNIVVVHPDGKLTGFNTDYLAVLRALEPHMVLAGSRVLILGAGGVARTAAYALAGAGCAVAICARREGRARQLAHFVGGEALPRNVLRDESFDAIVNATPVGMFPQTGASPLRAEELHCNLVFDTVYRPRQTRLLKLAAERGIKCVSGVEMFLAQGLAQWKIWTGKKPPEKAIRKAVLAGLRVKLPPGKLRSAWNR
jgi:3-dehydroquinate dehydratase / shikimate dehydrogenase